MSVTIRIISADGNRRGEDIQLEDDKGDYPQKTASGLVYITPRGVITLPVECEVELLSPEDPANPFEARRYMKGKARSTWLELWGGMRAKITLPNKAVIMVYKPTRPKPVAAAEAPAAG